jgi:hypothetical protein
VNAGLLPLLAEEGFDSWLAARAGGEAPLEIDASQIRNIYTFNALSSCLRDKFDPHTALQTRVSMRLWPRRPKRHRVC